MLKAVPAPPPVQQMTATERKSRARANRAFRLVYKRATAAALRQALSHVTHEWLADQTYVTTSLVQAWLDPEQADQKPAPAWWIARLPTEERRRAMDAQAAVGFALEREPR